MIILVALSAGLQRKHLNFQVIPEKIKNLIMGEGINEYITLMGLFQFQSKDTKFLSISFTFLNNKLSEHIIKIHAICKKECRVIYRNKCVSD